MRRTVLDTMILISAFLHPGGLADELLTLAGEGRFELVLSSAIIIEAWCKLISGEHIRARYPFSDERVHLFCLSLSQISTDVLRTTKPLSGVVRDPNDDTIISRDKDLLSIGQSRGVTIITPKLFANSFVQPQQSRSGIMEGSCSPRPETTQGRFLQST